MRNAGQVLRLDETIDLSRFAFEGTTSVQY